MSDPLESAFDSFADAAEHQFVRMAEEIRTLRAELATLRTETRAAPVQTAPDVEQVRALIRAEMPEPVPGPQGDPGDAGAQGDPGTDGKDGLDGKDGADSTVPGPQGEAGADGKDGRDGADGQTGARGEAGADGADSTVQGPQGERGERGADGIATREELDAMIEARAADIQVRTLADSYRGVYVPGAEYTRGNLTTWGGSTWLALVDTRSMPGEGADWQLIVKAGKNAKR